MTGAFDPRRVPRGHSSRCTAKLAAAELQDGFSQRRYAALFACSAAPHQTRKYD